MHKPFSPSEGHCHDRKPAVRPPSLGNHDRSHWENVSRSAIILTKALRARASDLDASLRLLKPLCDSQTPRDDADTLLTSQLHQVIGLVATVPMLCQAGNVLAYRPSRRRDLAEVFDEAVFNHLPAEAREQASWRHDLYHIPIVEMGVMLRAALEAFYFEWHPYMNLECGVKPVEVVHRPGSVQLIMPLGQELLNDTCLRCATVDEQQFERCVTAGDHHCSATSAAMCLASFIITIHGGQVVSCADHDPGYVMLALPVARHATAAA